MTPYRIVHEFRAPNLELFWQEYLKEVFHSALAAPLGMARREVLERRETEAAVHQTVRFVPVAQPPRFIRRFTGGDLSYLEQSTFDRASRRLDFTITFSTLLAARIAGRFTVVGAGPGRLSRTVSGEISVSLPAIGRRVERHILEDMQRSYEIEARFTETWLDDLGPATDPLS
jgi:hypothetical protein